jgi:hypothetical protein
VTVGVCAITASKAIGRVPSHQLRGPMIMGAAQQSLLLHVLESWATMLVPILLRSPYDVPLLLLVFALLIALWVVRKTF